MRNSSGPALRCSRCNHRVDAEAPASHQQLRLFGDRRVPQNLIQRRPIQSHVREHGPYGSGHANGVPKVIRNEGGISPVRGEHATDLTARKGPPVLMLQHLTAAYPNVIPIVF